MSINITLPKEVTLVSNLGFLNVRHVGTVYILLHHKTHLMFIENKLYISISVCLH